MADAAISAVRLGAAHDGEAELCLTLSFANGGKSLVTLDEPAASALISACGAQTLEALIGVDWSQVRDALSAASGRFMDAAT